MRQRLAPICAGILAICAGATAWALQRPAPEFLRAELKRILAAVEYRHAQPTWLSKEIRRLFEALGRFFEEWWSPRVHGVKEAWPVLYWALVAILCLLMALLIFHIVSTVVLAFSERKSGMRRASAQRSVSPDELRTRASQLAARGKYSEAITVLYDALIRLLDRADILRRDTSRTNWEYVDDVTSRPAIAHHLRDLAARIDMVCYGHADANAEEYSACNEIIDSAWHLAEESE